MARKSPGFTIGMTLFILVVATGAFTFTVQEIWARAQAALQEVWGFILQVLGVFG